MASTWSEFLTAVSHQVKDNARGKFEPRSWQEAMVALEYETAYLEDLVCTPDKEVLQPEVYMQLTRIAALCARYAVSCGLGFGPPGQIRA